MEKSRAMTLLDPAHVLAAALALSGAPAPPEVKPADVACLALNIYHEAKGQPETGQAAVAHVTMNRLEDPRFPKSVCDVVTERRGRSCQFGWTCRQNPVRITERAAFREAMEIAVDVVTGRRPDPTRGALYFLPLSDGVPSWARRLRETAVIGHHRFFRG